MLREVLGKRALDSNLSNTMDSPPTVDTPPVPQAPLPGWT